MRVVLEEGDRLDIDRDVLEAAVTVVQKSCDASLVQIR